MLQSIESLICRSMVTTDQSVIVANVININSKDEYEIVDVSGELFINMAMNISVGMQRQPFFWGQLEKCGYQLREIAQNTERENNWVYPPRRLLDAYPIFSERILL